MIPRDALNDEVLRSLRLMAWHRAIGELAGISNASRGDSQDIKIFLRLLQEFIKAVEDNNLLENSR